MKHLIIGGSLAYDESLLSNARSQSTPMSRNSWYC